jgi:hypothetical protein
MRRGILQVFYTRVSFLQVFNVRRGILQVFYTRVSFLQVFNVRRGFLQVFYTRVSFLQVFNVRSNVAFTVNGSSIAFESIGFKSIGFTIRLKRSVHGQRAIERSVPSQWGEKQRVHSRVQT